MWLKIVGMCLVVAGCGYWGFNRAFALKERIRRLQVFVQSLALLKNQIVSYRMPVPEAAEEISYRICQREVAAFYRELAAELKEGKGESGEQIWKEAAERTLWEEDKEVISRLGAFIGVLDTQIQVQALDGCIGELGETIQYMRQISPDRIRLYQTLGFAAGAFLVILLL